MKTKTKTKKEEMLPCPFCGCAMDYYEIGGYFRWYGEHKSCCVLESNYSAFYSKRKHLIKDWNTRR
jgi:hypothetical protein